MLVLYRRSEVVLLAAVKIEAYLATTVRATGYCVTVLPASCTRGSRRLTLPATV